MTASSVWKNGFFARHLKICFRKASGDPYDTEFYLAPDADGNLQVVSEVPSDVQAYIANVRQTESVQELITDVQTRYQEAMESNPDLDAYISALN